MRGWRWAAGAEQRAALGRSAVSEHRAVRPEANRQQSAATGEREAEANATATRDAHDTERLQGPEKQAES